MARRPWLADQQEIFRQFNIAFALTSVIPLLVCCYLIVARFFSITILVGLNGLYFLCAVLIAVLGLCYGRFAIKGLLDQLVHANADTRQALADLGQAHRQLTLELMERKRAEEALRAETARLELMNQAMMDRETRVLELKQEANTLLHELGRAEKYHIGLDAGPAAPPA